MKNILSLIIVCLPLAAQTTINGSRTLLGTWDVSNGKSLPFGSGTLANRPSTCAASKEVYNVTDAATPGQQVYVCNAAGNGWVLVGDGGSGGGGMANPMTTSGDLITGGTAGAAQRLAAGSNGQCLLMVAGIPAWGNCPAGFTNPMTSAGDLIIGGASGAATRLAAGSNGQCLTTVSGAPVWGSCGSGGGSGVASLILMANHQTTSTVSAGATSYGTFGGSTLAGTASTKDVPVPMDVTAQGFYIKSATAQPAGQDVTCTIQKNGGNTAISITIPGGSAQGVYSDTTHSAAFAAGDLIRYACTQAAGASASAQLVGLSLKLQ